MTGEKSGIFTGGAGLVWRRQRVLWWPFIVNLVLAHFAAHATTARVESVLDQSLASERLLVHGFHFSAILELMSGSGNRLSFGPEARASALIFFFFMLLATGGILESYWRDTTLTTSEFFQNGGKYFWRFLRLVVYLIVALIPIGIIGAIGASTSNHVDAKSISPFPAVWINLATVLVVLLLMMIVRLWFDMAEVIAVAEGERAGWRCLRTPRGCCAKISAGFLLYSASASWPGWARLFSCIFGCATFLRNGSAFRSSLRSSWCSFGWACAGGNAPARCSGIKPGVWRMRRSRPRR